MDTMDDNTGFNFGRFATIGVVATFKGLRRTVGLLGLLCLIAAGLLWQDARTPPQPIVVNPSPLCNREGYLPVSAFLPPPEWGHYVKSVGANSPSYYVREAKGTGWCLVKHDRTVQTMPIKNSSGRPDLMYVNRWYEVPSKYSEKVDALAPKEDYRGAIALIVGFIGVALLSIWLPATILAAVARRWLRDVKEEPL